MIYTCAEYGVNREMAWRLDTVSMLPILQRKVMLIVLLLLELDLQYLISLRMYNMLGKCPPFSWSNSVCYYYFFFFGFLPEKAHNW